MRRLPLLAIVLGIGGLVPFVACTIGILFFPSQLPVPNLVAALVGYGAVILSFLGAVHWGLALAGYSHGLQASIVPAARANQLRLALGVLPALVGWAALLVLLVSSPLLSLLLLLLGFALTALAEARASSVGLIPPSYMGLRWVLTATVMLCLLAALLARLL